MLYTDECHATKILYFPVSLAVWLKFDESHKKNVAFGEQTMKFYIALQHQRTT